ncbi:MAG TPA: SDR family oxidoreductase [Solirubrobacteraceae bacterium]|nr:SDR family oxidoreductase [Solirubrobacteraceae bacterium]
MSRRAGASRPTRSNPSSSAGSPGRRSSTSTEPARVALVTGANRGIGLEVCRQLSQRGYDVLLGARDPAKGARAALQVGGDITPVALDVADPESVQAAIAGIDRLDVLVNNAAILYDTWQRGIDADLDQVREALETNLLGAWRVTQAVLPLLRASPAARVVNVSSGAGALHDMGGGTPAYRTSKAALNALTRVLAAELRGERILVNAICPGWVATDMGGAGGRPVSEGAAGIVWAATLPDDGPTGGFFRDGRAIDW